MGLQTKTIVPGAHFLECPRWRDRRVWFSDFYAHRVYSALENGGDLRVEAEVPQQPSGLGWLPDGRLLITLMLDQRVLRREADGSIVTHADLSALAQGCLNDMVVDAQGCAFVGDFGFDLMAGAPLRAARIMRVDPDGHASIAAAGLWFPNGSVITPAGKFRVAETFGNRISEFDLAADGTLANRRTWAGFGEVPTATDAGKAAAQLAVASDGCCLDASDAIWLTDTIGNRAIRVRKGGAIVDQIKVDTNVFACMLGGSDGRTLFLCTVPDFHAETCRQTRHACLVSVRVATPRAGLP